MARRTVVVIIGLLASLTLVFYQGAGLADDYSGWSTPVLLEYGPDIVDEVSVAVDGEGNVFAVWSQIHEGDSNVWGNRHLAGHGWLGPEPVGLHLYGTVAMPRVAASESGIAVAVWIYFSGAGYYDVWSNVFLPGIGWGVPDRIEDIDGDMSEPAIAIDASGNAIVVWHHDGTPALSVMSCRYDVVDGWSEPEPIELEDGTAYSPRVAVNGSGDATAVWLQWDGARTNVSANHYVDGTGWGTSVKIGTYSTQNSQGVRVAVDDLGNAYAVWNEFYDGYQSIFSNRYSPSTGWSSPELLETQSAGVWRQQVACSGPGDAMAVWAMQTGSVYSIFSNHFVSGSGWSGSTLVETSDLGSAADPLIAGDSHGTYICLWRQSDGSYTNALSNRFDSVAGWGTPETIELIAGPVGNPSLAVNEDGVAAAIWTQEDTIGLNLYGSLNLPADTTAPTITVISPESGSTTGSPSITVTGETEPSATLYVDGVLVFVDPVTGEFSTTVSLEVGENVISLVAYDEAENQGTATLTITLEDPVSDLEDELEMLLDEIGGLREQVNETLDQLDGVEGELGTAQDDIDGLSTMATIMGVLAAAALLGVVAISIAYMNLRKRVGGVKSHTDDREPPPPEP